MSVASFCRNCGKALSDAEKNVAGTVYCESCAPAMQPPALPSSPPPPPPSAAASGTNPHMANPHPANPPLANPPLANPDVSPGLAFLLGLLPGVGAIYNGQYAKGLVHAFIFGLLITIAENSHGAQPLLAMMIAGWFLYMPFEAYHTARRRMLGQPVDEFSSLNLGQRSGGGFPAGPVMLIVAGILFLLNNLDILHFHQIIRFWPVLLIVLGLHLLREHLRSSPDPMPRREASDDLLR